jgi:hypothetical protein
LIPKGKILPEDHILVGEIDSGFEGEPGFVETARLNAS